MPIAVGRCIGMGLLSHGPTLTCNCCLTSEVLRSQSVHTSTSSPDPGNPECLLPYDRISVLTCGTCVYSVSGSCDCNDNNYGIILNGNRSSGPGSCFLKVRHFHSTQKAHHAQK